MYVDENKENKLSYAGLFIIRETMALLQYAHVIDDFLATVNNSAILYFFLLTYYLISSVIIFLHILR